MLLLHLLTPSCFPLSSTKTVSCINEFCEAQHPCIPEMNSLSPHLSSRPLCYSFFLSTPGVLPRLADARKVLPGVPLHLVPSYHPRGPRCSQLPTLLQSPSGHLSKPWETVQTLNSLTSVLPSTQAPNSPQHTPSIPSHPGLSKC